MGGGAKLHMIIFIILGINPDLDPGNRSSPILHWATEVDLWLGHGKGRRQGLRPGLGLGLVMAWNGLGGNLVYVLCVAIIFIATKELIFDVKNSNFLWGG